MKTRRAFIFSIDAFVAFSLALVALYSLVFFSAIPYNYYPSLMQAHNYAKDTLYTLSKIPSPDGDSDTALGYLVLNDNEDATNEYLRTIISEEFGYVLEKKVGGSWVTIADTLGSHSYYQKLKTTSYGVVFDFTFANDQENPYGYNSCDGSKKPCATESSYEPGEFEVILVRLTVYA